MNSAGKGTQSINFVAHNILLCFNSFALAPTPHTHTHAHPEIVPFFFGEPMPWLVARQRGATADATHATHASHAPADMQQCGQSFNVDGVGIMCTERD